VQDKLCIKFHKFLAVFVGDRNRCASGEELHVFTSEAGPRRHEIHAEVTLDVPLILEDLTRE
jgi:hypothetical protein